MLKSSKTLSWTQYRELHCQEWRALLINLGEQITTSNMRWHSYLLALIVAGTLAACGRSDQPAGSAGSLSGRVTVDGSATVFPLSKAMAEAFRESNPAVQFAVEFSGTGGGFKKFCAGAIDIADASRPIKSDENEQCKAQHIEYIEVPVAFDSLAVVSTPRIPLSIALPSKSSKPRGNPLPKAR